ncbi:MAG: hypothetical protein CV087_16715 [Candidatus Brocadia sp. WS118]|nr:MAG: hypothetical protein CV087_16715 [Candidatus Brocadia sp. WS118]
MKRRDFIKTTIAAAAGAAIGSNSVAKAVEQLTGAASKNSPNSAGSVISLPKGGGSISGIGETFQPNPFTGSGNFSVPIYTTPGRSGMTPQLALQYSTGNGNGPFGLGWGLSVPMVSRKTEKGIPVYDDEKDIFVLSGAEDLVPYLENGNPATRAETIDGATWQIYAYRPRVEGLFARIEYWKPGPLKQRNERSFWRIVTKDNITSIYGYTPNSKLSAPADADKIFEWRLELTYDAKGNCIWYEYKADRGLVKGEDHIPISEGHRYNNLNGSGNARPIYQNYLKSIYYGNLNPLDDNFGVVLQKLKQGFSSTEFIFTLIFDYGEHQLAWKNADGTDSPHQQISDDLLNMSNNKWPVRNDPFSSYRSGFEIRTYRRCERVLMFHQMPEFAQPVLVRSTDFHYYRNEYNDMAMLSQVIQRGYRRVNDATVHQSEDVDLGENGLLSAQYAIKSFPPINFKYSGFQPEKQKFQAMSADQGDMPPFALSNANFALVDLFGTGLPDVLFTSPGGYYFWKNEGKGKFSRRRTMKTIPASIQLGVAGVGFGDMAGNGQADLLVHNGSHWGFFEADGQAGWQNFKYYKKQPSFDINDPQTRMFDIDGSGKAGALTTAESTFHYFPCLGEEGFGDPTSIRRQHDLAEFPDVDFSSPRVKLADMSGDGLSDIVLVHSGRIDYWANMGRGKFSRRITLKNSPELPQDFDPNRLFLVDIDGSGTADAVYVEHDKIRFWFNQSGNAWSEEFVIHGTPPVTDYAAAVPADMYGNGSAGLLWTTDWPGAGRSNYRFLDFSGGAKPHLLIEMDNSMGAVTRVQYKSSTEFYLDDQYERGRKRWVSTLPFPVQCVEKVEKIDYISRTKLVTRYEYHHGYYDGREREFRGFAHVDQYDTEHFDQFSEESLHEIRGLENLDEGFHVAPVLTRMWFHTGAHDSEKLKENFRHARPRDNLGMDIHDLFAGDYYQKDPGAKLLNNTVLETNGSRIGLDSLREAYRALRGQVLRQEVYALDGKADDPASLARQRHPYIVTESNYEVRLLQGKSKNKHAVFFTHPHESIMYSYERVPGDPRVAHTFNLEVDEFGNVLRSANISYPRRVPEYPEQQQTRGTLAVNRFINETANFYRIGVPCEQKTYEIGGLDLGQNPAYFSFNEMQNQIRQAESNTVAFDQRLPLNQKHLRLLSWQRNFFWNEAQDDVLPLCGITARALAHHTETAIFPTSLIPAVFGSKITSQELREKGGYFEAEGHWWNPGIEQHYYTASDAKFFLPNRSKDPFGAETHISYDGLNLQPVRIEDALQNVMQAEIDYHTVQPKKLTDINDNVSEVLFDPLGLVQATSIYGDENGVQKGDLPFDQYQARTGATLEDILQQPHYYLQGATSFFYYDLHAWRKDSTQPIHSIGVMREKHARDLASNENSELQYHISFSDGLGREIQKKLKVEPGEAFRRNPDGTLLKDIDGKPQTGIVNERWLVSGRAIFNNKAKPVKQYEPFYSQTSKFEPEKEVTDTGVTPIIHYDPLLRVIRTDTPKGFFAKTEFTPWWEKNWDLNDTVMDSQYYRDNQNTTNANEKDALNKALLHYDTPVTNVLNNLGQRFLTIEENLNNHKLSTHYELDIQGNELAITDPRQYELNKNRQPHEIIKNFKHVFGMDGKPLSVDSVDAGLRLTLNNVLGKPFFFWNNRDFHIRTEYDVLQRPLEVRAAGNGLNQIVEKFKYGEGATNDKGSNLRGQLIIHHDQAGIITNDLFDIKGAVRKSSRQLREDYKSEVNWNDPTTETLESDSYDTEIEYDALGRVKKQTYPDGSEYRPTFHQSGLLRKVDVFFNGALAPTTIVENITYNAKGQREEIRYGNGVTTTYEYENETFRLERLITTRHSDNKILQNISYTYDPVGYITRIRDDSYERVCNNNQIVEAKCDYTYDSLYRLIGASGREHPALAGNEYKSNGFKQSQYLPCPPAHANDLQQLQNYRRQYTYDDSGNLIKIQHFASDSQRSWTREITPSETSNRAVPKSMLQPSTQNPEDFFDANGNLIKLEHLRGLGWNYRDNITSATIIESTDTRPSDSEYYVYDSSGQRVRKVSERLVNGDSGGIEIIEKIYLGNYEIKRIKIQGQQGTTATLERETLHVMDDQQRVALIYNWKQDSGNRETDTIDSRKFHYQLNNHLSSSVMELTEGADVISYEEYFPYGGTAFIAGRNQQEVQLKEYRYSGKERDDFTGLYYYGARYYAPWLGRWMCCDPLGKVDGINLFVFVNNNPLMFTDELGEQTEPPSTNQVQTSTVTSPEQAIPLKVPNFENNINIISSPLSKAPPSQQMTIGPEKPFSGRPLTTFEQYQVSDEFIPPEEMMRAWGAHSEEAEYMMRKLAEAKSESQAKLEELVKQELSKLNDPRVYTEDKLLREMTTSERAGHTIIYLRTNTKTGEMYVGKTTGDEFGRLNRRAFEHSERLEQNFEFRILDRVETSQTRMAEEEWIRRLGGPRRYGGTLENKRYEMNQEAYETTARGIGRRIIERPTENRSIVVPPRIRRLNVSPLNNSARRNATRVRRLPAK